MNPILEFLKKEQRACLEAIKVGSFINPLDDYKITKTPENGEIAVKIMNYLVSESEKLV